jgi:GGDEF domain-containing protein
VALAAAVQGWEPDLQVSADVGKPRKETAANQGHHHKWSTHDEGRQIGREDASSLAREMREGQQAGRRGGEAKAAVIARQIQKEQLRIGKAVRAVATQGGFDAQCKIGSGGRPVLMTSQQMERTTELQNPEVRAELNRRVHECKRKCSTGGRLGSIPQACARAKQRATREQIKGQWCESSTRTVCRRCDQV